MESVERILNQLEHDCFYGSIEIEFEAGKPVLLRKTETMKPLVEDRRDNRGNRDES